MQMCLFQKLTPEPHVSFHLEEFSLASTTQSSLVAVLGSLGLPPCKTKQNTEEKGRDVELGGGIRRDLIRMLGFVYSPLVEGGREEPYKERHLVKCTFPNTQSPTIIEMQNKAGVL